MRHALLLAVVVEGAVTFPLINEETSRSAATDQPAGRALAAPTLSVCAWRDMKWNFSRAAESPLRRACSRGRSGGAARRLGVGQRKGALTELRTFRLRTR